MAKSDQWVHARGAAGGDETGEERDGGEERRDGDEGGGIVGLDGKEHGLQEARQG